MGKLIRCPNNKNHWYSDHSKDCPWCAMYEQTGTDPFPEDALEKKDEVSQRDSIGFQVIAPSAILPKKSKPIPIDYRKFNSKAILFSIVILCICIVCGVLFFSSFIHPDNNRRGSNNFQSGSNTTGTVLPYEFYGSVHVDDTDAPIGTQIKVIIDGTEFATYTLKKTGSYGGPGEKPEDPRLIVPITDSYMGKTITFWCGTKLASSTERITRSGDYVIRKDLDFPLSPRITVIPTSTLFEKEMGADLIINSMNPEYDEKTRKISTDLSVKNIGKEWVWSYSVIYFLSKEQVQNPFLNEEDLGIRLGRDDLTNLDQGKEKQLPDRRTFRISPAVDPGTYWFGAIVDAQNRIIESNESNNVKYWDQLIEIK